MNKVEAWKSAKHGFDVWPDLERYATQGTVMAEIDEADLERMKWYGVFYRKRVEDGRYMIRVRIPGCEFTAPQARALAEIARVGYSILDVTTRGNVQIQGFAIGDLPGVLDRLETSGLTAKQTGHDNVRNVGCHPWAGIDPAELVDARPLCRELTDVFMNRRDLSNLPRKFNVAVDGRPVPAPHCWTQDTSFVAASRPDGSVAFHWLLAGTQGQNPRIAWKVPVWVRQDQAADVFLRSLQVYNDEGPREKRDRARLRYLIEAIGADGFLARVEDRLGYTLERTEEPVPEVRVPEDFLGWFRQKQHGHYALGVSIPLGRMTHEQMDGLADLAIRYGDGTLRAAYDQGIVIPGIDEVGRFGAVRALNRLGLEHEADSITRNILACTGRQFCNIAVSETKGHAFGLMDALRDKGVKLADIKIHMSGCPSSCAQTYLGDIGLKGVRVRRKGGTRDGFDVFLGGGAHGAVELGLPYRKGIDVDQLPEMIEALVKTYDREHTGRESFSEFWRNRIASEPASPAVSESEFRPDAWVCEKCRHEHAGEDPPIFCPKCAGLRKHFARLDPEATPIAAAVAVKTETRIDGYRDVAALGEVRAAGKLAIGIEGTEVALVSVADEVRCVDGLCPHEGGPMAQGSLTPEGHLVCPWHDWSFRTDNGCATDGNGCMLKTYPAKIEAGRVLVMLPTKGAKPVATEIPDFDLRVLEVIDETHDTRTIRLDNADGRVPTHRPGQHMKVGVDGPAGVTWRSFTISSPPTRPNVLDLTIKRNPGGVVSVASHALRPGDSLKLRGPAGKYYFDPETHREPLVLAAAGSGVTPAMSILRTILDRQIDLPVTLIYGARTEADVIFAKELDALRPRLANFRLVISLSRPGPDWTGATGRVDPALIGSHVTELTASRYFLCGPGDFHDALKTWLLGRGVAVDRIHTEMFGKTTV
jgi:precorrin-3B synthase